MKAEIILFGASKAGMTAFEDLKLKTKVIAFADNDTSKVGEKFCGRPIISPAQIEELNPDGIVICSMYSEEIYHQLIEMGFPAKKILTHGVTTSQIRPVFPWDAVFFLGVMIVLLGYLSFTLFRVCVVS